MTPRKSINWFKSRPLLGRCYAELRNRLILRRLAHDLKDPETLEIADRKAGFFSLYFQALAALQVCIMNRQKLVLSYTDGPYVAKGREGQSWWGQFFTTDEYDFRDGARPSRSSIRITDIPTLNKLTYAGTQMNRTRAHRLAQKIVISQEINTRVGSFSDDHLKGRKVIGIHYRGTDKVSGPGRELDRVDHDTIERMLKGIGGDFHLFVATDELSFLNRIEERYPGRVHYTDSMRSENESPLHLGPGTACGYRLGMEALVDALLLSRCSYLLRCDSNLSQASLFFNPQLPTCNLHQIAASHPATGRSASPEEVGARIRRALERQP